MEIAVTKVQLNLWNATITSFTTPGRHELAMEFEGERFYRAGFMVKCKTTAERDRLERDIRRAIGAADDQELKGYPVRLAAREACIPPPPKTDGDDIDLITIEAIGQIVPAGAESWHVLPTWQFSLGDQRSNFQWWKVNDEWDASKLLSQLVEYDRTATVFNTQIKSIRVAVDLESGQTLDLKFNPGDLEGARKAISKILGIVSPAWDAMEPALIRARLDGKLLELNSPLNRWVVAYGEPKWISRLTLLNAEDGGNE